MTEGNEGSSSGTICLGAAKFNFAGGTYHLNRLDVGEYAQAWFTEAVSVSKQEGKQEDLMGRALEIILSVCFVESYLLEWVRDVVLETYSDWNERLSMLDKYFPPGRHLGIKERWKTVLQDLKRDNWIAIVPDYGTQKSWSDFAGLVDLRDGLVHASASLPVVTSQKAKRGPTPTPTYLKEKMQPGEAVAVVESLVEDLRKVVGIRAMDWWPNRSTL